MAGGLSRAGRWVVPAWCLLLAAVVTGPLLLGRGFALVGDMVFVPEQPWKGRWLGVDGSVPRAVPSDALVSLLTQVVPGDLLQKAVLAGLLAAGGWGAARLVRAHGTAAGLAAATLYVWNPYVHERLGIGHWALLCGYAALPWVASAAAAVRDGRRDGVAALVVSVAAAALTSPTGGLLAGLVAVAVVAVGGGGHRVVLTLGTVLGLNLPWLLPGVLAAGDLPVETAGVAGFAARPDTGLGTLGSLGSLGGIWKSAIVPAERGVLLLAVLALLLVLAGLAGAALAVRDGDRTVTGLWLAATAGLLLAWLPAVPAVRPVFEWAGGLPGGGVLRDSQKWVAPLALLAAVGAGRLVAEIRRRGRGRSGAPALVALVVLLPVALLPGLAWGELGRLRPVSYPQEWTAVGRIVSARVAEDERVVVLPFEIYRRFAWNRSRAVLDPAPRFFAGDVVTNDVLRLGDGVAVGGEDPVAASVARALAATPPDLGRLRDLGVRWALVEKGTPGRAGLPPGAGTVVHDGPHLRLVDLGPAAPAPPPPRWRPFVLAVDALVAIGVTGAFGLMLVRRLRGRLRSRQDRERVPGP